MNEKLQKSSAARAVALVRGEPPAERTADMREAPQGGARAPRESMTRELGPRDSGAPARAPAGPTVDLVSVVRDVVDQAGTIAKDSVSLGVLEIRRVVDETKGEARDLVPRAVWGAAAAALGFVGAVLLTISLFIAAGALIPSVALRLFIVAALFLGVAAYGGFRAAKGKHGGRGGPGRALREARTDAKDVVDVQRGAIAPIHPAAGVGE